MFKYSYNNKRYHTLDYFYKNKFGEKVFKISLNAGFECPNQINNSGCIYCSPLRSGEYAGSPDESLNVQFENVKKITDKWDSGKYIAYFQAGTNTNAPLNILKEKFESVLKFNNVVGISIATRSDSISDEVLKFLEDLNKRTYLTIELGLQSANDKTLKFIKRGHDLENFEDAVKRLKSKKINVVVHVINGLPGETKEDMLNTAKYLNELQINGIKIHMLSILKNTPLEKMYTKKAFPLLTKEEYIEIVCNQLEFLNPKIIIHRLTGDPKVSDLIAPDWVTKKTITLNDIDKEMKRRNTYQGIRLDNHLL